jgi:ubiquinone/menaquinone biosynthesis C-methylase UbiE
MNPGDDHYAWEEMQLTYWDAVASHYDDLYSDRWSQFENRGVVTRLRKLLPPTTQAVLDLGCGTGLGWTLLRQALGREVVYHGIDISPSMLEVCRRNVPSAKLRLGAMTELSEFDANTFDAVTAFFGAGSYGSSALGVLESATRVVRPGGMLYLSFFGRFSLRRILHLRTGELERYRTRHERKAVPPLVRVYSKAQLAGACHDTGAFEPCAIEAQGTLAGLCQAPTLWFLSNFLDRHIPTLGHQLEVIGLRGSER